MKANLSDAIDAVERGLSDADRTCGTYSDDPSGWHAKHRHAMDCLAIELKADAQARINDRWDGARVRIAGIAASSTSGLARALRNWLKAARKRIDQGTPS